jgi:hypothetical protein
LCQDWCGAIQLMIQLMKCGGSILVSHRFGNKEAFQSQTLGHRMHLMMSEFLIEVFQHLKNL